MSRVWRLTVGLLGAATWLAIPLVALRANLELDARGHLTSGDSTGYLITHFIGGLVLAAFILSPFVGYLTMIRERVISYLTGAALVTLTVWCLIAWQTSDDGQGGLVLLLVALIGWPLILAARIAERRVTRRNA